MRPRQIIFFKPENPSALGTLERLLLRCCAIAAPVLGVLGIGRLLRLDEANSVLIASSNLVRIVEYLRNDYKLPAYYVLLHSWIGGTGICETAVHLPSVASYWLAIRVTYSWDRKYPAKNWAASRAHSFTG